jgi:RimJ/RimL family protein N-acetyltransferase
LLELLVQIGRKEKIARIIAHILPNNTAMQRVSRKCGFTLRYELPDQEWLAEIIL